MGGKRLQKITGILSEHIRLSVYHVMFLFSVKRVASVSSPNLTLQIPQLPRHSPIFSLSISHSPVLFHLFCSTSTFIFPVQKPLTNQTATHLSRPSCPILRLSFSYPVIQLSFPWHVLSHSLSLSVLSLGLTCTIPLHQHFHLSDLSATRPPSPTSRADKRRQLMRQRELSPPLPLDVIA